MSEKRPKKAPKSPKICAMCTYTPKPSTGRILGYVAQNPIPRAPSPPATPHFLWFPSLRIAQLVGRCLQLMIKELTMLQGSLGFAKLTGVRDLVWAAQRMGTPPQDLRLREQDMSDMFWEIPSSEAKQAVL